MKKSSVFLFCLRLFFYFSVTILILAHPGIIVSFDLVGYFLWFVIIPLESIIAFLPAPKGNFRNKCILAVMPLLVFSIYAGGFTVITLRLIFAGILSFTITYLLFYHPRWGKAAILEPFFLAFILLRLLAFSRSGESAAGQSMAITQFIFIWTAAVFLFHSALVYLCLFPYSRSGAGKEGIIFFLAAVAALLVVLVVLPVDFVRNSVITNLRQDKMPEIIKPSDLDKGIPRGSGSRRGGRRTIPGGNGSRQQNLRGISESNWPTNSRERGKGGEGEENQQYTVMIVASRYEPVFMGSSFRGLLDPVEGFQQSPDEPLNRLPSQRFFVSWLNNERNFDRGRKRQEVVSLSTQSINHLPYRPVSIDPTIISDNSGPLRYIHRVMSGAHANDPLELVNTAVRSLSTVERNRLSHYLEFPLEDADRRLFNDFLNNTLKNWREKREQLIYSDPYLNYIFRDTEDISKTHNDYMEIILALLTGFSEYQYNLSYSEEASIENIKTFLFNTKDGDCVEFSNTLALLGRLAGIPSRVVTGYLAAEGLQTPVHLRGLAALYNNIPFLREFPFEDLFLVTNAHGHSWTQFYVPEYGWLDFESTSFAIPPEGSGDISNWDVVIPIIKEPGVVSPVRKFPWHILARAIIFLAAFAIVSAYVLRYGREILLFIGVQRGGRSGVRSLYLLLLARLAADGKPINPASRTAVEFSQLFPPPASKNLDAGSGDGDGPFADFAALYTELRWREFGDKTQMDERFLLLKKEYRKILKTTKRRGPHHFIKRIVSLRGLAYL